MTIRPISFNPKPHVDQSAAQCNKQPQAHFSKALDQAQQASTQRTDEARKVLHLLQDYMLGQFTYQEEDMELLSSYDFIRPFTPAGYDAYRVAASTLTPVSALAEQQPSIPAVSTAPVVAETVHPEAPLATNMRANIEKMIDHVAERVGLPAALIHSVVRTESAYKPDAVSPVGAQGLMQLMPGTAQELGVENSFDPQQNLLGGSRYLKGLLQKYNGDLDHALAAYNWGQGNVDRKGLEHMPEETRNYIARVKQASTPLG